MRRTASATVAPAFAAPIPVQGAAAKRDMLVPLDIQGKGQQMYLTLYMDAGKPAGQSLMAAGDTCPATSRLLFMRDKASGNRFVIDTGAGICVCLRTLVLGWLRMSDYMLPAANGTHIATYGTRTMTLNLGLRRFFRWRFFIADVSKPILGQTFKHITTSSRISPSADLWTRLPT